MHSISGARAGGGGKKKKIGRPCPNRNPNQLLAVLLRFDQLHRFSWSCPSRPTVYLLWKSQDKEIKHTLEWPTTMWKLNNSTLAA